jgi:hypothetical protein
MSFSSVDDFVYRLVYRCPKCDTITQGLPVVVMKTIPEKECPKGCRVLHFDTGHRIPVTMESRLVTYGLASIQNHDKSIDIIDFFGSYQNIVNYAGLARSYIVGSGASTFLEKMDLAYTSDPEAFEYIRTTDVECLVDGFVLKLLTDIAYRNGQEFCHLTNKQIREHPMMQKCLHHLAIVHGAGMHGLTKDSKIARMLESHIADVSHSSGETDE